MAPAAIVPPAMQVPRPFRSPTLPLDRLVRVAGLALSLVTETCTEVVPLGSGTLFGVAVIVMLPAARAGSMRSPKA